LLNENRNIIAQKVKHKYNHVKDNTQKLVITMLVIRFIKSQIKIACLLFNRD